MLALQPGRQRRAARSRGALAVLPLVAGCSAGPAEPGAWIYISLSLLVAALAAYALGSLRERRRSERELRDLRARLRCVEALQDAFAWETDAEHRLRAWQGPGHSAAGTCELIADAASATALRARLEPRQPFAGLRLRTPAPQDGSCGWELRGVPRQDDLGRFSGFAGTARPTDEADAARTAAATLEPVLAASPAPMLVALDAGAGWQVQQFNPAAKELWPGLATGAPLAGALAGLPAAVSDVVTAHDLQPGAVAVAQGWRLAAVGPLADGRRGLVIAGLAPTPATAETPESDNFSFTVSHDLRAPIRVVEGFTRIVKEDYGRLLDRVGNDHLDRVLGAAARMNLMIDALLTLARLSSQPLARQPVNLSQLAGYVVDDLKRSAPEREAEFDIEPGLTATGDPTLLRLVLENLLGNAWKYTSRCSRAQVSLRRVQQGARSAFAVRDNGAGFDMRSAERLFGLFQRLHSASEFPGHGVGLASVRRIVRRHGGEIWAEAEAGRGAAFYFTLAP
jgi:signal transduction histidine kinase